MSLFCYALLIVLSSFAIILKGKRELAALLLLSYGCLVTVNALCLFLTVPWIDLRCVIVVFPDHTHLLYNREGSPCLVCNEKHAFFSLMNILKYIILWSCQKMCDALNNLLDNIFI